MVYEMKLTIENKTNFLNNYFFQTLCLLYFPGERFPVSGDYGINAAYFLLEKDILDFTYRSKVKLTAGDKAGEAEFSSIDYKTAIELPEDQIAMITVGKAFLEAGKKLFGFSLPWGHITGLRPVKRAKYYLERGYSIEKVKRLFTDDFGVFPKKAELAMCTASREINMLKDIDENTCGLYISIPFCPTRCSYCSFVSYSNEKLFKLIPDYLEKLKKDIKLTAAIIKELNFSLRAIYIGGGTPSMLDENQIKDLLDVIENNLDFSKIKEYSFEAGRPDTITARKLKLIKSGGVDRISINTQTTNEKVLKKIGRKHTIAQFYEATEIARNIGFKCINTDLIAGLPTDDKESFSKSVYDVMELGFENITVHTLSIKNAADLSNSDDMLYNPSNETANNCVLFAFSAFTRAGYNPYYLYRQKNTVGNAENTGYSKPGFENLYNVLMMEEYSTIFSCGAAAITKTVSSDKSVIDRIAFPKYPFEYLEQNNGIGEDRIREFFKHN